LGRGKHKFDDQIARLRIMRNRRTPDRDIMEQMHISKATLWRYKQMIFEQDKTMLQEVIMDNLAHEVLEFIHGLKDSIDVAKKIVEGTGATPLEKLEAEKFKIICHGEIVKTLNQGPYYFANIISAPTIKKAITLTEERQHPTRQGDMGSTDNREEGSPEDTIEFKDPNDVDRRDKRKKSEATDR
jgi:hypothetical protein